MKRVVNLVKNSWRFCIDLANRTSQGHSMLWVGIRLFFDVILDFWRQPIRRESKVKMQIFKAELKSWMHGEFASLKSKHDSGVAEANQQNLLNVIANKVKQSLKATQNVIANKVKQSFWHCHCEQKARQSFQLHNNRLPRRYAPRNDDEVASNRLPRRYAPRNDDEVASNGLPRRYAPRNDDEVVSNRLPRRYAPRNDGGVASNELPRRYAPRNDDVVASNGLPRRYAPRNDDVVASNGLPRRYAPRNDDGVACNRLPRRYTPRNDDGMASNRLPRRYAPRNDDVVASNGLPRRFAPRNDDVVASNRLPRRYAPRNDDGAVSKGLPRRCAPRNDDCNVCGRSMIEMLGVLAIIGVLSVGGIAGYSKAMEKWKINKAISEYNDFIFGILEYKDTLYKLPINNGYADIANSLGFFPKTWTYVDSRFAKDSLKQTMQMWKSIDKDRKNVLIFEIYFNDPEKSSYKESVQTLHYCRSFFSDFARPLDKVIISATLWRNTPSVPNISWYGSNYCSADRQCITDLSVTQIDEQCRTCADTKGSCTLLFTF